MKYNVVILVIVIYLYDAKASRQRNYKRHSAEESSRTITSENSSVDTKAASLESYLNFGIENLETVESWSNRTNITTSETSSGFPTTVTKTQSSTIPALAISVQSVGYSGLLVQNTISKSTKSSDTTTQNSVIDTSVPKLTTTKTSTTFPQVLETTIPLERSTSTSLQFVSTTQSAEPTRTVRSSENTTKTTTVSSKSDYLKKRSPEPETTTIPSEMPGTTITSEPRQPLVSTAPPATSLTPSSSTSSELLLSSPSITSNTLDKDSRDVVFPEGSYNELPSSHDRDYNDRTREDFNHFRRYGSFSHSHSNEGRFRWRGRDNNNNWQPRRPAPREPPSVTGEGIIEPRFLRTEDQNIVEKKDRTEVVRCECTPCPNPYYIDPDFDRQYYGDPRDRYYGNRRRMHHFHRSPHLY